MRVLRKLRGLPFLVHWEGKSAAFWSILSANSRGLWPLRAMDVAARPFRRRHVHADGTSGRTDLSSGEKGIESGVTPEIEDALARAEASDRLRVAAAQTEVGAAGNGGEVSV